MYDPGLEPPERGYGTKPPPGEPRRADSDFFDVALLVATITFVLVTAFTIYLLNVVLDGDWSDEDAEVVLAVHTFPGAIVAGAVHSLIRWLPHHGSR